MEFLTLSHNQFNFTGNLVEALCLLLIPQNSKNSRWQVPLQNILDAADSVPKPWKVISVKVLQKSDMPPEEVTVTLSKEGRIKLVIDLQGLHLVHPAFGLRCKSCPLPKDLKLIPETVKQARVKFLEILVHLSEEVK